MSKKLPCVVQALPRRLSHQHTHPVLHENPCSEIYNIQLHLPKLDLRHHTITNPPASQLDPVHSSHPPLDAERGPITILAASRTTAGGNELPVPAAVAGPDDRPLVLAAAATAGAGVTGLTADVLTCKVSGC